MTFDPAALSREIIGEIKAHAIRDYPHESCGAITPSGYRPLANTAMEIPGVQHSGPQHYFDCRAELQPLQVTGELLALVHSHPNGPWGPSALDIQAQIDMDVPWGILICNDHAASAPYWWGDNFVPPPLLGREFRHGPSGTDGKGDCYALIRDWYRLERGVILKEGIRDDNWWANGQDLYTENFTDAGFVVADRSRPEIGDVVLMAISSKGIPNHGAVYVGGGLVMHHLTGRVSRLEPVGRWLKHIVHWLRHEPR